MQWLGQFQVVTKLPDVIPISYDFLPSQEIGVSILAEWQERNKIKFPRSMTSGIYFVFKGPDIHAPAVGAAFRVPVHSACLAIVARVLKWRKPYLDSEYSRGLRLPTNIQQLYDALREAKRRQSNILVNIEWPNLYHGARSQWSGAWLPELGKEWLSADPVFILDSVGWTATILSLLRPLFEQPAAPEFGITGSYMGEKKHTFGQSKFENLPVTVYDGIRDNLDIHSVQSLRMCSSKVRKSIVLTPRFWRDRLLNGEAVPWLWDIDARQVKNFSLANDWGALVQALRMPGRYNDDRLPIGLRNRIRIFTIIAEIRLELLEPLKAALKCFCVWVGEYRDGSIIAVL
ncbi:hypothetical protein TWF106_002545 [Orbilia oligospora]|uniref:F-box domain-containing protein n=1 Tax=Orbilia oligospora TaxID=2813651 RepID=A0A7C8QWR3_ORBOL|nr:hypothetical protein TWF106_002545 [Orbilia oligospora]